MMVVMVMSVGSVRGHHCVYVQFSVEGKFRILIGLVVIILTYKQVFPYYSFLNTGGKVFNNAKGIIFHSNYCLVLLVHFTFVLYLNTTNIFPPRELN